MRKMYSEKQIEKIIKENSTKLYKHNLEIEDADTGGYVELAFILNTNTPITSVNTLITSLPKYPVPNINNFYNPLNFISFWETTLDQNGCFLISFGIQEDNTTFTLAYADMSSASTGSFSFNLNNTINFTDTVTEL